MRDQEYRWNANGPSEPEDDLDRVLNAALAIYATVEAREGLEQRILANLSAQEQKAESRPWAWGLAAAVLAMAVVALVWHLGLGTRTPVANHPAIPQTTVKRTTPRNPDNSIAQDNAPVQKRAVRKSEPLQKNPKLDQFPSPQPMSEQERLLAMYINQDPEHAALIAEARMEALRQDEAERLRATSTDDQGICR